MMRTVTRHSEDTIRATARLLRVYRAASGLTQEQAAELAGQRIGKRRGLAARTWVRAEAGYSLCGSLPAEFADGEEDQQSATTANLTAEILAVMALTVDIPPEELVAVGRADAAELMEPFARAAAMRAQKRETHQMVVGLSALLWRLDEVRLGQARALVEMCAAAVERLVVEQELMPPRQRQRERAALVD